jgi:hypothetical protein
MLLSEDARRDSVGWASERVLASTKVANGYRDSDVALYSETG